jgi:NADPH:quinone reductase-like Zn-dependent oxidoreductase
MGIALRTWGSEPPGGTLVAGGVGDDRGVATVRQQDHVGRAARGERGRLEQVRQRPHPDYRVRVLLFTAYGGPEVLTWGDAPVPHPLPGQIRIAVRAASVNPVDWKILAGALSGGQPLAGTGYLGYDAAGVVDEVGEGVTGVSRGDDVFGRGQNAQAEYAVLDAWAAKPPSIDWAVAAAAGVTGETSERGLRLLGVKTGNTIFVDGGAGGVGAVAVQMAVVRGARVIVC